MSGQIAARRVALDWANLLCDAPIDAALWPELLQREQIELPTPGRYAVLARKGAPDPQARCVTWNGDGVWLRVMHPDLVDRSKGIYQVTASVQGALCSTSRDGLAAVNGVRRAIVGYLYDGVSDVLERMVPGKVDVCIDTEIPGGELEASNWIEREVFARGNVDGAGDRFVTRMAPKRRRIHGGPPPGSVPELTGVCGARTLYQGRDPRLMTYEKDRDIDEDHDLELVKPWWRLEGWGGEARVIRNEIRTSRDWMTDNDIRVMRTCDACDGWGRVQRKPRGRLYRCKSCNAEGRVPTGRTLRLAGADGITWDEFARWVPTLARELFARTRHCEPGDPEHRDRWEMSELWHAVHKGIDAWETRLAREAGKPDAEAWRGVGELVVHRRRIMRDRTIRRAESALVAAHVHWHAENEGLSLRAVATEIADAIARGTSLTPPEKLDALQKRYARRAHLPRPPALVAPTAAARFEVDAYDPPAVTDEN